MQKRIVAVGHGAALSVGGCNTLVSPQEEQMGNREGLAFASLHRCTVSLTAVMHSQTSSLKLREGVTPAKIHP